MLDAVERSVDPLTNEIQVFKFLNNLYNSAREYERMSTESQIHFALREVEAHSKTLAKIEEQTLGRRGVDFKRDISPLPMRARQSYQPTPDMKSQQKKKLPKETFL